MASRATYPMHLPPPPDETARKRVLLVDDHPILRQGLANVLNTQPHLFVCGEAQGRSDALAAAERLQPDLALIDLSLRTGDGIELLKDLRARLPNLLTLVLSMHDETIYAERALRAGARGYVMKQEKFDRLLLAIGRVLSGAIYVSDQVTAHAVQRLASGGAANQDAAEENADSYVNRLTDRELQVFSAHRPGARHPPHRRKSASQPQNHREPPRAYQGQARVAQRQRTYPARDPVVAPFFGHGGDLMRRCGF